MRGLLAELLRRFSPVALTAAVLLLGSGLYAVYRFLGSPERPRSTSAYGLTLLVKLTLLAPLLVAAWVNFRVIRPGLFALSVVAADVRRLTSQPEEDGASLRRLLPADEGGRDDGLRDNPSP